MVDRTNLPVPGSGYNLDFIEAEGGERIEARDLVKIPPEELKPLLEAANVLFKERQSQIMLDRDSSLSQRSFTTAPKAWEEFQTQMGRIDSIARRLRIGPYQRKETLEVFDLQGKAVLDLPSRHALFHLPLYKRSIFTEAHLHKKFVHMVQGVLQKKLGIQDESLFQKIWEEALASHQIHFKENEALTVEKYRLIEQALQESVVYSGKGIDVSNAPNDPEIHEMIQFLLGRGEFSHSWVINYQNLRGVFLEKDLRILRGMEREFAGILQYACLRLPEPKEEAIFKAFVGNILALLPYAYPEEGTRFTIPQKIDGRWQAVSYVVDKRIELTPRFFSTPIVAYGLTSELGPPLLTFLGTTYPAADGFVATVLADCTPFFSVGRAPYLWGKEKIAEWLHGKKDICLYGMSLGGALSFHTFYDHRSKIKSLDVYNPPGLYWKEKYNDSVEVNIYYQENDIVASMGFFPEGEKVSVYRVFPEKMENPLKAHARVYTGSDKLAMLKSDPAYENSRSVRIFLTFLHFTLCIVVPLFAVVLVLQFLYRIFQLCCSKLPKLKTS